ncbi:UNVERIFIED_CONTAM: hypothetical protein FKN15_051412 [Acipenser sinensis]
MFSNYTTVCTSRTNHYFILCIPRCDADPSALAKYVVALVKKDKTEKELKALCLDQLDVFLQKDTQIFVDKLFNAVNSKSYLPQFEQPSSTTVRTEPFQHPEKDDVKKDEVNKEEERDTKKIPRRINHSPQQSSSRYRDSRIRDDRKKDDRSRKRDYERNPPRRDSYRDRYNRRRGRSRSYSRSRSRSKDRPRDQDQDRSRTRSRSRTSRERDTGKSKYDLDRTERTEPSENNYTSASLVSSDHYPVPSLSSTITVIAPTHHGNNTSESWSEFHEDQVDHGSYGRGPPPKKRCRDYDEKGFCMRGDMCPFDHGSDPVVVEDVNLPGMLPFPAQPPPVEGPPPPGLPPPPPMMTPPPLNLRPPGPPPSPLPPSLPLVHQTSAQQPSVSALKQSVKDRLGPIPSTTTEPTQPQPSNTVSTPVFTTIYKYLIQAGSAKLMGVKTGNTSKLSVKERLGFCSKPSAVANQTNTSKLSVKERLGFCSKPSAVANQTVLSTSMGLTKTVYNPAALKAIQKTMPFVNTGVADHSEALKKKQEALRLQQDVRKKKQEIVGKHIETQKILISKLEKNKTMKPEDKAEIMKTLKTLTNSITKLKDELKAISSGIPHKIMKTKAQMQKELLDSELDLYKKMQAGEDVAQLRKKYTELQLEAAKRGILSSGRGRGGHARGRGALRSRGRGMRGRGRGAPLYAVVDRRPRALEISGFTEPDREDLLPYFAQFGEIEDWKIDDSSLNAIITYRTRAEAEAAAVHGAQFKGQDLKLAWHKPVTTLTSADPEEAEPDEEEFQSESLLDDALLQDDDEEDDDNESRAWRR